MRKLLLESMATVALCTSLPAFVAAQAHETPPPPQIVTSAQGEVRVTPDRATVTVGVQTRAATAADASAENARKQRAVIDAIRAKGVPASQIQTSGYNVVPETRYDREGQEAPRTTSYLVMNNVTVQLQRVDLVGPVIDAALGAGANQIQSLSFSIASADSARRAAIAIAVARAKADADAAARAAGGSLGQLLELNIGAQFTPPPMPVMRMDMAAARSAEATPIEVGEEEVRVMVTGRWRFISS
jgi:uncharacterized protein YggE